MVCLPLPALHPLDSERPFFSTATKGEGSDCAGTFTGPLCFQMVLFSCDTVDTQHLPRIRTLLWGSTEGRWVVCRRDGERRGEEVAEGRHGGTREEDVFGGWNFLVWIQLQHHLYPLFPCMWPLSLSLRGFLLRTPSKLYVFYLLLPPPAPAPAPHPVPYSSLPLPSPPALPALLRVPRHSRCLIFSTSECLSSLTRWDLDSSA